LGGPPRPGVAPPLSIYIIVTYFIQLKEIFLLL
jgi:hypothetical protein